jgi:hypothetical protein
MQPRDQMGLKHYNSHSFSDFGLKAEAVILSPSVRRAGKIYPTMAKRAVRRASGLLLLFSCELLSAKRSNRDTSLFEGGFWNACGFRPSGSAGLVAASAFADLRPGSPKGSVVLCRNFCERGKAEVSSSTSLPRVFSPTTPTRFAHLVDSVPPRSNRVADAAGTARPSRMRHIPTRHSHLSSLPRFRFTAPGQRLHG